MINMKQNPFNPDNKNKELINIAKKILEEHLSAFKELAKW